MKRAVVAGVVAAAMVLGAAGSARAQSVSPEVRQQAERRMARGVELRGAGRDEDALVELRAAYELNPEPRAAAQLGLVNQALGNWLEADRLLREALAASGDGWVRRNRAALEQAAGVVDQRVGSLIVRGNVQGAEVRVDGRVAGRLPMSEPVRVLAGEVSVQVRAEGYAASTRRLTVRGGETLRESFELRVGEEGGGAPSAAGGGMSGLRSGGVVAIGVGVGLLGAGVAGAGLREGAAVDYNANCVGLMDMAQRCVDWRSTHDAMATLRTGGFVAGGALVVGGAVMVLLGGRREETASRSVVACEPGFGHGSAYAACAGRF